MGLSSPNCHRGRLTGVTTESTDYEVISYSHLKDSQRSVVQHVKDYIRKGCRTRQMEVGNQGVVRLQGSKNSWITGFAIKDQK